MSPRSFLVTGGNGFLGAWVVRALLSEDARGALGSRDPQGWQGSRVVVLDRDARTGILEQVLDPQDLARLERIVGDVTDLEAVERALHRSGADVVIHLAALQVPACRSDPAAGAIVNVAGTLNVFEAVRRTEGRVRSVVYASSAAVAGPGDDYDCAGPIPDDARHRPRTHYGVFKAANEAGARVYWLDHGIPSAGLRPLTVYGVGRELGITSGPTKAIKAAVLGRPYAIGFRGTTGFHYAEDVAAAFVACARALLEGGAAPREASRRQLEGARAPLGGAHALNLRGEILDVEEFVRILGDEIPGAASLIRVEGDPLPIAHDFDQGGLDGFLMGAGETLPRTSVAEGIRRTADRFRELRERGRLGDEDLQR